MLFRRAKFIPDDQRPGMKGHGLDGDLFLRRFRVDKGSLGPVVQVSDKPNGWPQNLIDGVLTRLQSGWRILLRSYPESPSLFTSNSKDLKTWSRPVGMDVDAIFLPRPGEWGKMFTQDNALYQVVYGGTQADKALESVPTRPGILRSDDGGKNWALHSWVTPPWFDKNSRQANETAVLPLTKTRWIAVSRTHGRAEDGTINQLYWTLSDDGGKTWQDPQKIRVPSTLQTDEQTPGLPGDAPMLNLAPDGRILLQYRGLHSDNPQNGGMVSLAAVTVADGSHPILQVSEPTVLANYKGNRYDGGYGDAAWSNRLNAWFGVYYTSQNPKTRFPTVKYAIFRESP